MRKLSGLVALLLFLATGLTALAQSNVTVDMTAQNNSGQTGTATLEPMGNQTKVTINITPGPAGVSQPAHIHMGTCDNLNPVPEYPLNPVVNGQSVTTINVSLQQLESQQRAVNVHQSAQNLNTYVSCGDLPVSMAQQTGATSEATATQTGATTTATETVVPGVATQATSTETSTAALSTPAPSTLPSTGGFPIEFVAIGGLALLAIGLADRLLQRRAR
ncbi:MAG: hypothetical protein M1401_17930 [Chloroflexi bacterium]|nr:hypothetical protein [Chloroflexota bacterium]